MEPKANPLLRLVSSSKALVATSVILASFVALFMSKATWEQVDSLMKWVLGVWMGAQGLEDAAKHLAAPAMIAQKTAQKNASTPPPANDETKLAS